MGDLVFCYRQRRIAEHPPVGTEQRTTPNEALAGVLAGVASFLEGSFTIGIERYISTESPAKWDSWDCDGSSRLGQGTVSVGSWDDAASSVWARHCH